MQPRLRTGDYERVARADAQLLLTQASEQTGIYSVLAHGSPSVGRGLRELAEAEFVDLVVIGATRRAAIANIFGGDATRETLRAARGAVAVAPVGYADRPSAIRKIGVVYDASQESRGAAAVGRDLAGALRTKLSAIQVVDIPMYIVYSDLATETVDLLVMGSWSLGRVGQLLHSSRSQNLARRAQCPLLVVTEAAADVYRGDSRTGQPVPVLA